MRISFEERRNLVKSNIAKKLIDIILSKKTNVALSADLTHSEELFALIAQVGEHVCVLKTHIDILVDFDNSTITELKNLAQKYNFLLFEDRKFADIGNTVRHQYGGGLYNIADWSSLTTAHIVSGPGIISSLREVGLAKDNGVLLLSNMSSKDNLMDTNYSDAAISMAQQFDDFVIGFINCKPVIPNQKFLYFSPGVHLAHNVDNCDQTYLDPHTAIAVNANDIIIVGRGIYQSKDPAKEIQRYKQQAWHSYLMSV